MAMILVRKSAVPAYASGPGSAEGSRRSASSPGQLNHWLLSKRKVIQPIAGIEPVPIPALYFLGT